MQAWWSTLERRARVWLAAGVAGILLLTGMAGWWVVRGEQAVLFTDLRPQDAALFAAELDKQKVPYAVTDGGSTLLVDKAQVHATRLKLMGKELPLHGAVGLELFSQSDFGMTEFAQKINYQRALQGELTRTILSFPEIRDARVHLALPEQGLFKQSAARPKAAITLTMRSGQHLRAEQVNGIQRLAAAAVAGLTAQEVTIVDQHGVALSRSAGEAEGEGGGSFRLDLKRDTENYLSRKVGAVLERAFGPGQALASVDVTLNMEQVRVTTEDVIAAPELKGGTATGVLVRERESARDTASPDTRPGEVRTARGSSMQRDVEYQAGRRVEQVVSHPGSIRRLHVVALMRAPLTAEQQEQVRKVVAAAVGASADRGDTIVVQSFAGPVPPSPAPAPAAAAAAATTQAVAPADPAAAAHVAWWALPALLALGILGLGWQLLRRNGVRTPVVTRLSDAQRGAALQRVEAWLHEDAASPVAARGKA
jgi:flagellar M-ring protein FliF